MEVKINQRLLLTLTLTPTPTPTPTLTLTLTLTLIQMIPTLMVMMMAPYSQKIATTRMPASVHAMKTKTATVS
jgi:hypothetical protein